MDRLMQERLRDTIVGRVRVCYIDMEGIIFLSFT